MYLSSKYYKFYTTDLKMQIRGAVCIIRLLTQSRRDRTALNHYADVRAGPQSGNLFVI